MNSLISFAQVRHPGLLSRGYVPLPDDSLWSKSPLSNKFVWNNGKCDLADPNTSTMISGMCCVRVTSLEILKNDTSIKTEMDFLNWYALWYPRIDQVHDGIGIPPKLCKKMIYVVEDYIHAQRVIKLRPNWDLQTIVKMIKTVHLAQGHSVVCNWVENYQPQFRGAIECIFLSDILKEIATGIKIAKKFGFKNYEAEKEMLKFMYTSFWPQVLGIEKGAIICEPIKYINRYQTNYNSILDEIPIIGFLPYVEDYEIEAVPHDVIPHRFGLLSRENDYVNKWFGLNVYFNHKDILNGGPDMFDIKQAVSINRVIERVYLDSGNRSELMLKD